MELWTAFSLTVIPLPPPMPVTPRISSILSYRCPLSELRSAVSWLSPLQRPFYSELRHLFFRRAADIKAWVRDSPLVFLSLPGYWVYDSPPRVQLFASISVSLAVACILQEWRFHFLMLVWWCLRSLVTKGDQWISVKWIDKDRDMCLTVLTPSPSLQNFSLLCLCFFSYMCWVLC